jgi:hypothetical protein
MNRKFSIGGTILAMAYALFALVGCGGSGGETSYTVGGTVSGLAGSGLVLSASGSGPGGIPISANGSFTFPLKYPANSAYGPVEVTVPPNNPAQTCVITNGSGTVGTSNVTNVSVVCTNCPYANSAGCIQTYTVGGTVSGLEGSGLKLSDLPDPGTGLAISANGSFTLADINPANSGYSVYVTAQPANPSQTCSITNGIGTVGNSNVTDIAVVCVTGVANAQLQGTYSAVHYEGDSSGLYILTFDGAGNFSGTDMLNNAGTVSSAAVSGTYTVAADGTLNISPTDGSTITGSLTADGNTLVTAQESEDFDSEILVGFKEGQTNFSNASLTGIYTAVRYAYGSMGDSGGLWTVTFDGAGNFSGTDTLNNAGMVSSAAVSGTYTVAADGTLTIDPTGGATIIGSLSADGTTMVSNQAAAGSSPQALVGIRQGQTNFSNTNLMGTYTAVRYDSAITNDGSSTGDRSSFWNVTFDGAGNFSGTDTFNIAATDYSATVSGTYTVAADGTLTITETLGGDPNLVAVPFVGGLSADGHTLVASQTTSERPPSILVGIMR